MKSKRLLFLVPLFALTLALPLNLLGEGLPVLTPEDDAAVDQGEVIKPEGAKNEKDKEPNNKKEGAKAGTSGAGLSIMSAEQGEELQKKIDKLQEDQKKILEKLEQMQKDLDFIRAAARRA